jgi:hypothetical protein
MILSSPSANPDRIFWINFIVFNRKDITTRANITLNSPLYTNPMQLNIIFKKPYHFDYHRFDRVKQIIRRKYKVLPVG